MCKKNKQFQCYSVKNQVASSVPTFCQEIIIVSIPMTTKI